MQTLGVRGLFQRVEGGDLGVFLRFSAPDHGGLAVLHCFLVGFVSPRAGDDVIDGVVRGADVERHGGELGGGAALEEEDGVILGDAEESPQIRLGFLDDGEELLPAVMEMDLAVTGLVVERGETVGEKVAICVTEFSFPVAAFWWNPTIFLELSLEKQQENNLKGSENGCKQVFLQKLVFCVAGVPLAGLAPLANAVERALGGVDGGRRQKGRRELEHLVLHEAKLDQEEGHELQLLVGLSRLQEPLHEHIWSWD
nr:Uncharacterised protein [Ipomoea batatas]